MDIQDHLGADKLTEKELLNVKGGLNITASLISSFVRGLSIFLDVGRSLGSALRRTRDGNICKI